MAVLYTNNAASTLSASISLSATSFSVASGQGALFPAISGSDFFYVTLVDSASNIEIVKVTARSTDTFTVVRGQDGTLARAWSANDKVELRITKAMLDQVKVDALQSVTNLAFTGTGNRVTGDFSNATVASRVLFQTSTANGNTFLSLAPNGTAVNSQFQAYNSSDTANASIAALVASATQVRIVSGFIGSGTLNPITFIFSSTEAARFDPTTRNFLIGSSTDNVTDKLQVTGSANITGALKQNGNQVLHAGNYSSYALPLTGGTLTGAIAVIGQTINGQSHYQWDNATYRNPGDWTASSIVRRDNATVGINGHIPALVLYNNNGGDQTTVGLSFASAEGATGQGNSVALAGILARKEGAGTVGGWSSGSLNFYVKNGGARVDALNIGSTGTVNALVALQQGGNQVLHAGNYTSYSPSLTGSGASGTWGISITGYGYGTSVLDTDRTIANRLPNSTPLSVRFDFANANAVGTGGNYAGVMTFSPWTGTTASTGDASYQLVFGSTAANGGGNPLLRLRKGIDSTWNSWVDVLTSANISSYALPLTGGTLSGNLLITNAASPNTYYFQFGDNSGWKFRYMTNVSGTPTERFGFTDTGNFSAVGSVTWGSGNAAAVMNSGNPRSLAIGFSGGNYGGASYGVNYTTTSGSHTYAFADIVSRWDAYDGLIVYAAPSGTVGATVSWTNVLDARRSNASLIFKGNTVLDASNYTNYVAGLGGGNYTGTIQVTQSGVVDAFKSVNTSTTLTDESSLRFQKTMTPTGTATTNSLGGMEWEGKNSNGTSYEMARIYATNITSTSLDSGNYAVGELHLASYRYIGGYSESVRMRLSGGNIYWHFSGTERLRQDSAKIYPSTSGAYNLGDASFKFGTVFTNSITFGDGTTQSTGIPTTYTISYLVVAGGGGGGNSGNSGGGGGGGVLAANVSLAVGTTYSVTVGAGGAVNAVGGSSSFGLFATANGGGAGGAANAPGGNGGSGGGGGFMNAAQAGGSGTAGQGYAGGASTTAYGGGGGGGAGAVGNAGTGNGGNGGTGFTSSITGTTTVYGGGGGGGSNAGQGLGGSGGGGNGGPGTSTAGAVNTGGGGGGFGNTTVGRGGGSGVVILQIPTSNYTGLTTGSPTVTTSGSYTILKFTSSGSYTA